MRKSANPPIMLLLMRVCQEGEECTKWQDMMNGRLSHGIVQTVVLLLSDIEMHKVLSKFNVTDAVL